MPTKKQFTLFNHLSGNHRRGPITDVIPAQWDIPLSYGHDIHRGQLCFVARARRWSDGVYALRYNGQQLVARVEYIPGGAFRIMIPHGKDILALVNEVEPIGPVVGCSRNTGSPILWMYGN